MGVTDCFRGFLRIILVVVNIFVSLLGLLVLIVGIWGKVRYDQYFEVVSDNKDIVSVPVMLIVLGLFITLLGIGGTVGALFAGYVVGRILVGVYAFILALLVICEIAGGIAAAVKKDDLSSSLETNLLNNFKQYNESKSVSEAWNTTQKSLKCCGYHNYTDYHNYFEDTYPEGYVPDSCCTDSSCTPDNAYPDGCYGKISDYFSHNLSVVAGVGITFGFLQIIGVIVSCFVAVAGTRDDSNKYQTV